MLEEVTPQLLTTVLFLVITVSSALTLIGSMLIVWLYRRSVLHAMAASSGRSSGASAVEARTTEAAKTASSSPELPVRLHTVAEDGSRFERLFRAPWRAAARNAAAGLVFALAMALAVTLAWPEMRTLPRFALCVWVAAWPIVLAVGLTAPGALRSGALAGAAYFAPFVLATIVAAFAPEFPIEMAGGEVAAIRNAITPVDALRNWLVWDGIPTLLLVLFLNRRTRAVGPLVLGFMTTFLGGVVFAWLALARGGAYFIDRLADATGLSGSWLLLAAAVLAIVAFAVLGWLLLRRIRSGYLRKTINERSLTLDALWLVFASFYSIGFALLGLGWAAAGLLAFAAYKLASMAGIAWFARSPQLGDAAGGRHGLVFLRVFSLGRRSDELFDAIARYWRYIGTMELITGPDVVHSTVQPHQFLDFLAGRLADHFVADAKSLELRMKQLDAAADRDGLFRINNFFCYADTWEAALARLVQEGDVVLMDLRNFSSDNAGCVRELRHLVNFVPLGRCVFVVDETTDHAYLRNLLRDEWKGLAAGSPNRATGPETVKLHHFGSGSSAFRQLLRRLCEAA